MNKNSILPTGWAIKKSSEYCFRVTDGTHDTPQPVADGKKLITSKNIKNGRASLCEAYCISENDYIEINKRSRVDQWDVLFSMIGTVGEMALVTNKPDYAIKNIGLFKCKSKTDGVWLYYYLSSPVGQAVLETYQSGTSQKFVSLGDLRKISIISPPDNEKIKVTAILSAYDDLIENNQRRIALLEKMAEELYREWFVRLRFPGYEKTKFEKGVPEGWFKEKLPAVAGITYGFPFQGDRFNANGIGKPIIRIRNIPDSITLDFTNESADEKYLISAGDLLVGMDGNFHINHWSGEQAWLVQRACRIKAKENLCDGYLAQAVVAPIKHFEATVMGATVAHLGAKHLNSIDVLMPPKSFLPRLEVFNDFLRQKISLAIANRKLRETRDMLLPRLISGKLSVEHLDIQFPPSMQEEAAAPHPNPLPQRGEGETPMGEKTGKGKSKKHKEVPA